jgi:PhnB protein
MSMTINPYLNFNGNCGEAFRFYADALGGKDLRIMTFRDSPMAG